MENMVYVGIDVSKDKFDYAAVDSQGTLVNKDSLPMNREGFNKLGQLFKQFDSVCVGFESTGTYHVNLLTFLLCLTENVHLLNPALVKKFADAASLRKTKTDAVDSLAIAKFLVHRKDEMHSVSEMDSAHLTQLARLRESISKDIAKTKTHLKQMLNITFPEFLKSTNVFTESALRLLEYFPSANSVKATKPQKVRRVFDKLAKGRGRTMELAYTQLLELAEESLGTATNSTETAVLYDLAHLRFLQNHQDDVTTQLVEQVDKHFGQSLMILKTIKGIGDTTASHLLSEIKDIHRFSNAKQLIAYAGTDPSVKQSGQMNIRGKISKRGVTSFRRVGYLITCSVVRHDGVFREYFLKKRDEGMASRKAIIATWSKLLRVIFVLLTKQVKFVPNHG
ncbi:MAG: IS110 family transposase [Fidelibacterota bacterium]